MDLNTNENVELAKRLLSSAPITRMKMSTVDWPAFGTTLLKTLAERDGQIQVLTNELRVLRDFYQHNKDTNNKVIAIEDTEEYIQLQSRNRQLEKQIDEVKYQNFTTQEQLNDLKQAHDDLYGKHVSTTSLLIREEENRRSMEKECSLVKSKLSSCQSKIHKHREEVRSQARKFQSS